MPDAQRPASRLDESRISLKRNIEALSRVQLRNQIHVRHARPLTETESAIAINCSPSSALADPMADPRRDLRFVMPRLPQPIEHADVMQRMHIATDHRRHAAYMGAGSKVFGE